VRFHLYVLFPARQPSAIVCFGSLLRPRHANFTKEMSLSTVKKKKRGAHCFICGSIEDDENHRFGTFEVNTKRLSEWEKLIPKPGLKVRSAICGRHFDADDIIKGREIGGIFQPFKHWKLKDHSVPKHFLCNIFSKCSCENWYVAEITDNFYIGEPVDPLAESLNCSQAKKGMLF
jgi:hypothetical protein